MRALRDHVRAGQLGQVHAVDLIFHNAYGPDKPWFHDPLLSGGGCMMDLGVHLIDLALWVLDFPEVERIDAALFAKGHPLEDRGRQRSEEHTSELQSLMRISYAVFCLKKKKTTEPHITKNKN